MKLIYFSVLCSLPLMLNAMDSGRAQAGNANALTHTGHSHAEDGDISTWLASSEEVKPIVYRETAYLESLFKSSSLTYASFAEYFSSIDPQKNSLRLKPFLDKHQGQLEGSADGIIALAEPSFTQIEHAFTCLSILSKISNIPAFIDKRIHLVKKNEHFLQDRVNRGLQSSIYNEIVEALASCKMLLYIKRGDEETILENQRERLSAKINGRPIRQSSHKNSESGQPTDLKKNSSFLSSPRFIVPALITVAALVGYLFLKRYKEKTGKPSLLDFALSRQNDQ